VREEYAFLCTIGPTVRFPCAHWSSLDPSRYISSLCRLIVICFHLAHDSPSPLDAHRSYFATYSIYFSFYLAPHTLAFLLFNLLLCCRLSISPTSCPAPRVSFYIAPCSSFSFLLTGACLSGSSLSFGFAVYPHCALLPGSLIVSCRVSQWCVPSLHICIAMAIAIRFYPLPTLWFSTKNRRAAGAGQNDVIYGENYRSRYLIGRAHAPFIQLKLASPLLSRTPTITRSSE
jgi:hypothetical protein